MQAATESKNEKGFRQRGAVDRDLFCPRLDAYLGGAAAAHGLRGTLASVTASIERGGVGGGGEDPNIGMLMRVGYLRSGPGIAQHRESERRFRLLTTRHQATALAHYLGTSRVHATLRASFGDLDGGGVAGVVLYRWQLKQAKTRQRDAEAGFGQLALRLDPLSSELAAIEREIADCQAVLTTATVLPEQGPRPERPHVPLVLARKVRQQELAPYWRELREWGAPLRRVRVAATQRRQDAETRLFELSELAYPLRAKLARLLAQQAALAATGSTADDEQALVDICRNKLTQSAKDDFISLAQADVRATHRDWYASGKKVAKAWVSDAETVA